jgi:uncharacterized zinc-type alcohol dehydrogenase-like protein
MSNNHDEVGHHCDHDHHEVDALRRNILLGGLVAAPLVAGAMTSASAAEAGVAIGDGPYTARAYGIAKAGASFAPMQIKRRALGPNDVFLEILYCGVCHSDVHHVHNEWKGIIDTVYPCVPGHEFVGRVTATGSAVTKFKVGDIGGVGCLINSCLQCENCLDDQEQFCSNGSTGTYNDKDPVLGGHTYGGYSENVVVPEHFVVRIPPGIDLAAAAPLMCAGITTFSPIQHWHVGRGQRVGIIGLGGLGHMAVKLAAARQADVTVFTTSPEKIPDAVRMGAKEAVLWSDAAAMRRLAGKFDLLISTVPQAYPMQQFVNVLKLNGTLVNVGALEPLQGVGASLLFGRRSIAGSIIGGIAETQQVVDFCAAHGLKADVEMIGVKDLDRAYQRVINKDVRYRFVIDMASLKAAA